MSKFFLKNKNVVYVGGLGGIGIGSCKALLAKGIANLYIVDKQENPNLISKIQKENQASKIHFCSMDITKPDEIKKCLTDIKDIDVLVNGAGICDDTDVDKEIAINLTGLIKTTILAFELMDKSKSGSGGVIVNISSIAGLKPMKGKAVYGATKHAVVGFSRSLGNDFYLKKTGISVLCICPGYTETPMATLENVTKGTFEYSGDLCKEVLTEKPQSADEMGELLVKIVEINKNGSVWLCRMGTMEEVVLGEYEEPK
ncbi:hypothetical protein ACFFRR_011042 [Megaselia abdita]